MKRRSPNCLLLLVVQLQCLSGCGGLSDYSHEIAPGWSVHRMNSFDNVIGRTDGELPYTTGEDLGPLHEYAIMDRQIVAKHFGPKRRNLRPDDDFLETDTSRVFYLVINMDSGEVTKPSAVCPVEVSEWVQVRR